MAQRGHTLGIDFGTSNSAAGYLKDGQPLLIEMAPGQTTLPTTFFFDFETRRTLMGEPANRALLDGAEGRFMRALKRVLGTPLMHEQRQILNQRVTFVEIIARFLAHIKTRAEAQTGLTFTRALSGRPVVFHGAGDPREAQAEDDLRACYLAAGFIQVDFMAEPQAAAIASGALDTSGQIGLIVDIGGGTSDFSLFRSDTTGVTILANHGVRIGGTDFDRSISIDRVMPLLGKGTQLRKVMGAGFTPVPNAIFNDLATWEKIPFLYTGQNRRQIAEMVRLADEPEKLGRLASVLQDELGHDLAFAVERGKIAANSGAALPVIALDQIKPDLCAPLSPDALTACLLPHAQLLWAGAQQTLQIAGLPASGVDRVIYVGGSSLMSMVSHTMQAQFPHAQHSFTEVFTAVTDGLAMATAGR
ncbi:Chaperone protein DnaK [Roseovarius litorisediminis]|uniref:Chaperone protein DnaK n=1 Tax=Roseovarius litorisediminis TaxID=1312363 RepID=A0A1Y5SBY4_9RHOB|nr:Hsp70 family protein [Roseovarius litorisediminis]SLN36881.1 Chaperone protein DnaK [Roseovarius litorisediminis]